MRFGPCTRTKDGASGGKRNFHKRCPKFIFFVIWNNIHWKNHFQRGQRKKSIFWSKKLSESARKLFFWHFEEILGPILGNFNFSVSKNTFKVTQNSFSVVGKNFGDFNQRIFFVTQKIFSRKLLRTTKKSFLKRLENLFDEKLHFS